MTPVYCEWFCSLHSHVACCQTEVCEHLEVLHELSDALVRQRYYRVHDLLDLVIMTVLEANKLDELRHLTAHRPLVVRIGGHDGGQDPAAVVKVAGLGLCVNLTHLDPHGNVWHRSIDGLLIDDRHRRRVEHVGRSPHPEVAARHIVRANVAIILIDVRLAVLDLLGLDGRSDGTHRLLLRLVLLVELSLALTVRAPETGRVFD